MVDTPAPDEHDPTPPVCLTIAGIDSAGGAGVHADLRAFAAHRVHGATAVAALTAQATTGIDAVHVVPADFVARQIDVVVDDLTVVATKTGFLASADTVAAVAARAGRLGALVVDPVLVTAAGAPLFAPAVEAAYRDHLLAAAVVATPNRVEAARLLDRDVVTVDDMAAAAEDLVALGPHVVVVKGGDAADEGDRAIDVVATADGVQRLVLDRVDTNNDHGSGCSFAAATAAGLARGAAPLDAVRAAKAYVHRGLVGAARWRLGAGHGPIDAFGWTDPGCD